MKKKLSFLMLCFAMLFYDLFSAVTGSAYAYGADTGTNVQTIVFSVSHETDTSLSCGVPVSFTIVPEGTYYDAKYMLQSVKLDHDLVGDYSGWINDPSYSSYQESPDFTFTFYASGTYEMDFYMMARTSADGTYSFKKVTETVTIEDPDYLSVEAVADKVADECKAKGFTTDFEKALWLHDWLLDKCTYDNSYVYCGAEGALCRGLGKCESYYAAYKMLLSRVGIESKRVTGNSHVWNMAKLDGNWYQIDATWDDNGYSSLDDWQSHLYFGLTDELMQAAHSEHTSLTDYTCDSYTDNYFIKTGEIKEWSDPFAVAIKEKIEAGEDTFTLSVNSTWPKSYNNILYPLVAYDLSTRDWSDTDGNALSLSAAYENNTLVCELSATALLTKETPTDVKLSAASFTYNGKTQRPAITAKNNDGASLTEGVDYTISYSSGCKNVGSYKAVISFVGNYEGTVTKTFKIVPKGTSISAISGRKKGFYVKWKKQSTQTKGYQIRYSTKSSMTNAKIKTIAKVGTLSKTVTKLSGKKKYYVQVRTYKKIGSTVYYSGWSSKKAVTTKN